MCIVWAFTQFELLLTVSSCSMSTRVHCTKPPTDAIRCVENVWRHSMPSSFPGPAQLSVAYSSTIVTKAARGLGTRIALCASAYWLNCTSPSHFWLQACCSCTWCASARKRCRRLTSVPLDITTREFHPANVDYGGNIFAAPRQCGEGRRSYHAHRNPGAGWYYGQ